MSNIPKFTVCEVCRLRVEACKCEEQPQPLQPPQPGDDVWVRAVVDRTGDSSIARHGKDIVTVRISSLANDHICVMASSDIHPAPPASAKKGA